MIRRESFRDRFPAGSSCRCRFMKILTGEEGNLEERGTNR